MEAQERIYLDHAATTPLDEEVLQKMLPYFTQTYGNANSQHYFGRKAMGALDEARGVIARLIGAKDNEVYFTSGGTEADNLAVFGAARAQKKRGRNKIFVSAAEHHAVVAPAEKLAAEEGFETYVIPVDSRGRISLSYLEENVDDSAALVAVMYASNELGTIQPVQEAAEIAHAHGAAFFTDAVQAAPYLPLNVRRLGADYLSFSVLYVKGGTPTERVLVGGEQEQGFRAGTVNVAGAVGAAAAYEKAVAEMDEANEKILALKTLFLKEISRFPFVHVNGGDGQNCVPPILNVRVDGAENAAMLSLLDLRGIAASAGAACAGGDVRPSRVLTAAGLTEEQARDSFRLSFGKHNTKEEIVRAAALIGELASSLRDGR